MRPNSSNSSNERSGRRRFVESSGPGVNHRNVSIISIEERKRERERREAGESGGEKASERIRPLSPCRFMGPNTLIASSSSCNFAVTIPSRVKVLRLVITPIKYACRRRRIRAFSLRKPSFEHPMMLHCARTIINVNRSHRCCDPFRGRESLRPRYRR